MKHAVIVAHPNSKSLTCQIGEAYAQAVGGLGDETVVRDLYRIDFDPRLKAGEIPGPGGEVRFGHDVIAERALLHDCGAFAFIYPLWFNAPPAILKGYIDRVFSTGFGYQPGPHGVEPLLTGRKLISFTTSGAPEAWLHDTGAYAALTTLFDAHIAGVCGLSILDHVHTGDITPGVTAEAVAEILASVRTAAHRGFAPQSVL